MDELVNGFREELDSLLAAERNAYEGTNRLLVAPMEPNRVINSLALVTNYRVFIESMIQRYGKILPYPRTDHKKVVARDLARRKPFKKDGSGYRDLLIWESIKSLLMWGTERLVFITNNTRDFGEGPLVDPDFHSDFLNPSRLSLYKNLKDFNDKVIIPRLDVAKDLNSAAFGPGSSNVDIVGWLTKNLIDVLYVVDDLGSIVVGFPDGVGTVRPVEIVTFHDMSVEEARTLESGEKLLRVRVDLEIEFSIDYDWEDYTTYPEVRAWSGEDSEPFSSASSHHIGDLRTVLDLIVNLETHSVTSCEVRSLDGAYGNVELL